MTIQQLYNGAQSSRRSLLIVGDVFHEFTDGETCLTVDTLLQLPEECVVGLGHIVVGQGVGSEELRRIVAFLAGLDLGHRVVISEEVTKKVDPHLVHKNLEKNVLISQPHEAGDLHFTSFLIADAACAELSDHVTGIHLQGMLLIEAARQMFMACGPLIAVRSGYEQFNRGTYQNALREIQVRYLDLLYPVPTRISLHLTGLEYLERIDTFSYGGKIQFEQLERVCAQISCKAISVDSGGFADRERELSARVREKFSALRPRNARVCDVGDRCGVDSVTG